MRKFNTPDQPNRPSQGQSAPSDRIKAILKERNMTQQDLADVMELQVQSVKQMLNKESLRTDTLKRVADALNVPMWQLFVSPDEVGATESSPTSDYAKLEHRLTNLERAINEILQEVKKRHQKEEADEDGSRNMSATLEEIKQGVGAVHQSLHYHAKDIKAECEGISHDFRDLFSLLDDIVEREQDRI